MRSHNVDGRSSRIFEEYSSPRDHQAGIPPNSVDYPGANPYPTLKDQKAFEKGLMEKTNKQSSDIVLYDNRVVVFKMESDVMIYVIGGAEENEVLLYSVVVSLRDALAILLGGSTDKRTIVEKFRAFFLWQWNEDSGRPEIILGNGIRFVVASGVSKSSKHPDAPNMKSIDLSEQGLLNAWEFGKRRLGEQLRQGL
ncbi:hypothetical protein CISG_03250 [Coccidioides immitis RMSCC 3703]|uniref:Coatomer subunit zeta n=1 Tax=Coccidioides immitis RMSCC 3703 TaxID=454286 RepID=A0A0J8QK51_COCIT|nr:hypothetical protein CISG_03250 [Coccidioides immitis RMSCC 3703]